MSRERQSLKQLVGMYRPAKALHPAMFSTECCCHAEGNEVVEVVWSDNPAFFRRAERSSYKPLYGAVGNLDETPPSPPSELTAPVAPLQPMEARRSPPSRPQRSLVVPAFEEEEAPLRPPEPSQPATPAVARSHGGSPKEESRDSWLTSVLSTVPSPPSPFPLY